MRDDDDPGRHRAPLAVRSAEWDHYELTDELETFLREAGTSREIEEREQRLLLELREVLRTIPPDALTDEQRFFVKETMGILREHLAKIRSQAEWAEAMLAREGWRFSRTKNRLERARSLPRLGHKRFREDVVSLFQSSGNGGNTRAVRVQISEALREGYPEEMLSPRAYFPIWQILEEHIKRQK